MLINSSLHSLKYASDNEKYDCYFAKWVYELFPRAVPYFLPGAFEDHEFMATLILYYLLQRDMKNAPGSFYILKETLQMFIALLHLA